MSDTAAWHLTPDDAALYWARRIWMRMTELTCPHRIGRVCDGCIESALAAALRAYGDARARQRSERDCKVVYGELGDEFTADRVVKAIRARVEEAKDG